MREADAPHVRFRTHGVDVTADGLRALEELLQRERPTVHLLHKSHEHRGEYPLGAVSYISALAAADRDRMHDFVVSCESGHDNPTVVTQIAQLCAWQDLASQAAVEPLCQGIAQAFVNPHGHAGAVQVSAQFRGGICVAETPCAIVVRVACTSLPRPTEATVTAARLYEACRTRWSENRRRMQVIRRAYAKLVTAGTDVRNTAMSGHKVWIFSDEGHFLTFYLVKNEDATRRRRARLQIVGVDVKVIIADATEPPVDGGSDECSICMEALTDEAWQCAKCCKALHQHCAAKCREWKMQLCPLCRNPTL